MLVVLTGLGAVLPHLLGSQLPHLPLPLTWSDVDAAPVHLHGAPLPLVDVLVLRALSLCEMRVFLFFPILFS